MNISLFFRDDDLGMDMVNFNKLIEIFYRHKQKLNAAAVPLYAQKLTSPNQILKYKEFLEVHTHGFSHDNYQIEGKKGEFGSCRKPEDVLRDLIVGKRIISENFPGMSFEAFTPPWNRIDGRFIPLLAEAKFKMISRDGNQNAAHASLMDLNISIDLHTAKPKMQLSCDELFNLTVKKQDEVQHVGIMLHHMHMANEDFSFLEKFLIYLNEKSIAAKFYSEIHQEAGAI